MTDLPAIPWRGPGGDRPDLPLPPARMPLRRDGQMRKRWRYVGLYDSRVMLCAARAQIGPLGQCFWGFWIGRETGTLRTRDCGRGAAR